MPNRARLDLALTAASSLACLLLILLPLWGPLQILAVVPLVLFLPGYAITAATFPHSTLSRGERLVYSFMLSIAGAALGGFVWQLAFGLSRVAWTLVVIAVTLVACLIARRRRVTHSALAAERRSQMSTPRFGLPTAAAALVAVALAAIAIAIATQGVHSQRAQSHFSALWIASGYPRSDSIEVAVENHQRGMHEYTLEVAVGGKAVRRWQGRLGSRQRQALTVSKRQLPPSGKLVASLYKDGVVYRRAELEIASAN